MFNIIVIQKEQVVELSTNLKRLVHWWISQHLYVVETFVRMRILRLFGESVSEDPNLSIHRRAQQLRLSQSSTWRILRNDLSLFPYKIQLTQELKPNDHLHRRQFADWARKQLEIDLDFGKKIIFSDEAHFWLNGFVNKQNCRIWGECNPQEIQQRLLHSEKVTVWCGFWSGSIIGPYFFQNETGVAFTVNGDRYRFMITDSFWPSLYNMDLTNMWFQQDDATCHTWRDSVNLWKEKFEGLIIWRNGNINYPRRSFDLTPLD